MGSSRPWWTLALGSLAACGFQVAGTDDARTGADGDGQAPVDAFTMPDACILALGSDHSCLRRTGDSSAWCFGDDGYGELGTAGGESWTPGQVQLGAPARMVTSRFFHSCAALDDGTARCWGQNDRGQIGDGTLTNRDVPTPVSSLSDVVEIAAARTFNCARRSDASITCWGDGGTGQLGDGTFTAHPTPSTIVVGLPATPMRLSLGAGHGCALLSDRSGWCWGANAYGQLGDGLTADRGQPVALPVGDLSQIAAGGYSTGIAVGAQTCVLKTDHTVWCWGSNEFGQLGNGATSTPIGTPAQVPGLIDVVELVMGRFHVCARRAAGSVVCWGHNDNGEVGDGSLTDRPSPTAVALPRAAIQIDAGGYHSCALLDDASLYCWGANAHGQLGDGTTTQRPVPTRSATVCQ